MPKVKCHECGTSEKVGSIASEEARHRVYSDYGWSFWEKAEGGHLALCDECTLAIKRDWQKRIMNGG